MVARLRDILPLKDFRYLETIAQDIGECGVCELVSARFNITVKIRPVIYQIVSSEYYYWDNICMINDYDVCQKLCQGCKNIFESFSDKRFFSQTEFLSDIRNARRTLVSVDL